MWIEVDLHSTPPAVTLAEPHDFKAFKVVTDGPPERLAGAVASFGRLDGDHVYVDVEALRRLAGARAQDAGWQAGLDAMLGYARDHGWTDQQGAVRAHVESR